MARNEKNRLELGLEFCSYSAWRLINGQKWKTKSRLELGLDLCS